MKVLLKKKMVLVVLMLGLSMAMFAVALFSDNRIAVKAETQDAVHLYDVEPVEKFNSYFAKQESTTLGVSHYFNNPVNYKKYIFTAVAEKDSKYISTLEYDISQYDFNYFKTVVGSCNMETQEPYYTNQIKYSIIIDGVEKTATQKGLMAGETAFLECGVPEGAQKLVLKGESVLNQPFYGDANWVDPILMNYSEDSANLITRPVSQNSYEAETGESYATGTYLIDGQEYPDSVFGITHGNYGTPEQPVFKFSAIYDVSGTTYNKLSVTVGVQDNPEVTQDPSLANEIVFSIYANDKVIIQSEPLINGESQVLETFFPAGTQEILLWAQSNSNKKAYGAVIWGSPSLSMESITPELSGEITPVGGTVYFGTGTPQITGVFKAGNVVVDGLLTLDENQDFVLGTNFYNYTFSPYMSSLYNVVKGKVQLTITQAPELNLADMQYESISSWLPTADSDPYFVKGAQVLGTEENGNLRNFSNGMLLVLHGPYEEELPGQFFSSITFDISQMDYDYFTVYVGNRNLDPTNNNQIMYMVYADGEEIASTSRALVFGEIGFLAARIPDGTQELRLHAYSTVDIQACGDTVWAEPTLKTFSEPDSKVTPVIYDQVVALGSNLRFGDPLPEISGTFAADNAIVSGEIKLNPGQTLLVGENEYDYTFVPQNSELFNSYEGKISISVGKGIVSGISFEDMTVDYDGNAHTITIQGDLPIGVTVEYQSNVGTKPGTYAATALFVVDSQYENCYETLPSLQAVLTINALTYISEDDSTATFDKSDAKDIVFNLSDAPQNLKLKLNEEYLSSDDFALDGKILTVKKDFLKSLAVGEYTLQAESDGGDFDLIVNVAETEKAGCQANIGGVSAFAAIGMILMVAFVVFRRK